jgi:hypothetical protein
LGGGTSSWAGKGKIVQHMGTNHKYEKYEHIYKFTCV